MASVTVQRGAVMADRVRAGFGAVVADTSTG
jgi:hypothetical protein